MQRDPSGQRQSNAYEVPIVTRLEVTCLAGRRIDARSVVPTAL
jgi:hypothetical protein